MGNQRWDNTAFRDYSTRTSYQTQSTEKVFANRNLVDGLNPSKITLRESCDSDLNPNSTPIILGLDVTGSMGKYAHDIAVRVLPSLINNIIDFSSIKDPHIMFMGIGDVRAGDSAPLQVSQFESDIKVLESLRELFIEGGGGGNSNESYDLAWYFAANKTKIDSFDKRAQKGFLFTFGDELPAKDALTSAQLKRIFNNGDMKVYNSLEEQLAAAQEKYHVFHIVIEQGGGCRSGLSGIKEAWHTLLGKNALFLKDVADLEELIISTISIASGTDPETIISEAKNPSALKYAYNI